MSSSSPIVGYGRGEGLVLLTGVMVCLLYSASCTVGPIIVR